MPIVRLEVKNEYGLGNAELYKEASRQEDPKALLDGLAVSGLVGILRQLGDLAEFAAEVFHGLQEQVMTTSSRSHTLMVRVQNIEAALPPLEKAVLAQTSHIHFAYTAGSEWHPHIKKEQNHFIYNDLPRFIMDSYEECRDPPQFNELDKFDAGGPGSCLKRYSDPTFFRKVSGDFKEPDIDELPKDKKAPKRKKKRSLQRNGDLRLASMSNLSGRMQCAVPFVNGRTSSYTTSTVDTTFKSDLGDQSNSCDSRTGYLNYTVQPADDDSSQVSSRFVEHDDIPESVNREGQCGIADNSFPQSSFPENIVHHSSGVTCYEKAEIMEPGVQHCEENKRFEVIGPDLDLDMHVNINANPINHDQICCLVYDENSPKLSSNEVHLDDVESEPDNYMDALNTIESESDNDLDFRTKHEVGQVSAIANDKGIGYQVHDAESHISDHHPVKTEPCIASNGSPNIEASRDLANPVPSESSQCVETSCISVTSSLSDSLPVRNDSTSTNALEGVKLESLVGCPTSSGFITENALEPLADKNSSTFCKSKESAVELSGGTSGRKSQESQVGLSGHDPVSKSQESQVELTGHDSVPKSQESKNELPGDISVSKAQESQVGLSGHDPVSKSQESHVGLSGHDPVSKSQESQVELTGHDSVPTSQESKNELSGDISVSKAQGSKIECSGDTAVTKSQESKAELSGVTSVTIWTNGGLLGLEPSKPPDFARSNAGTQDSVIRSRGEEVGPPNHKFMPGNEERVTPGKLIDDVGSMERGPSSKSSSSWLGDQDAKIGNSSSFSNSCWYSGEYYCGSNTMTSKAVTTQKELPADVPGKASSTEFRPENDESSSGVFGIGHRLLRTLSLASDGKAELASSLRTNSVDQSSRQDCSTVKATSKKSSDDEFRWNLSVDSPTSSPPLEQMKISFHPDDCFEASKLKLKFPGGSHENGSCRDAFPSFQLVPDNVMSLYDVGSASDDDTFCRSSPFMSDDCFSHCSDLGSELWESGKSPESNDHELYDDLHGISSLQSVSPSLQTGEAGSNGIHLDVGSESVYTEYGADSSLSASLLDLPSFDAMSTMMQGRHKDDLELRNILHDRESTPLLPPLPPVQWRASTTPLDVSEAQQHPISEAQKIAVNQILPASVLFQQPNSKPGLAAKQLINEKSHSFSLSKQDEQKSWQKEANLPANGKDFDEKEDFLHQIRTKSFSLRPMVTAKPILTSGPTADDKVTAILRKANAIRQAVGSDDDNWSDS